jgi:hypothetical protein
VNENLKNYESNERYLAKKLFQFMSNIKQYTFTEGHICYDTIITTQDDKQILGEIKVRSCEIDEYPDYILEVNKVINLIKKKKLNNYDSIYYINFFQNKNNALIDFIVFNLYERAKTWKTVKPIIIKKWMNAETYLSKSNKVEKQIMLLKYDEKIDMKGTFVLTEKRKNKRLWK